MRAVTRRVRYRTYRRGLGVACSDLRAIPEPHVAEQQQCSPAFFCVRVRNILTTNQIINNGVCRKSDKE